MSSAAASPAIWTLEFLFFTVQKLNQATELNLKARVYLLRQKTAARQVRKILDFILVSFTPASLMLKLLILRSLKKQIDEEK